MAKAPKTNDESHHLRSPLSEEEIGVCTGLLHRAARFGQTAQVLKRVSEWTQIRPDLKSSVVAASYMVEAAGAAMSDASKRRLDFDEASNATNPWEFVATNEPSGSTAGPLAFELEKTQEGYVGGKKELFPVATTSATDPKIPLPDGIVSIEQWGKTICRMDKVKSESLTYDQMVYRARTNSKASEDMR